MRILIIGAGVRGSADRRGVSPLPVVVFDGLIDGIAERAQHAGTAARPGAW